MPVWRVFLLLIAMGCGGPAKNAQPGATLSNSSAAAEAFAAIRESWQERRLVRSEIEAFLARWPADGSASLAKVYLAFSWIDAGQRARADAVLRTFGDLPPGTTRDLATVARARSLRLAHAPQSALDSLRPLVGKMVDDADREVFLEELALSALHAHDDYEALAYLDAWLRGVGEDDKDRVKERIGQILETLPRAVLEQTYRTMRARGASSGYGPDTQKLVGERLARVAVQENDAALARWLVDASGASAAQTGGAAGLEFADLAASRRGLSAVSGRTVGLLLPTRDRELRDEAADVVRGISWALDLPRSSGKEDTARLVTREDGTDLATTRTAMEELAGEGASVIIGGFDREGADRARQWSEASGVPVLLLAAPSPSRMRSAVVLGERPTREITALAEALGRHGVTTAALVVDTPDDERAAVEGRGGLTLLPPVRCDVPLAEAGKTRFPVVAWRGAGARGWLVSGPSACARDLLRDIGARSPGSPALAVALTLEAGIPLADVPRGITVLGASAGIVPVLATRPEDSSDPDVKAFMERFGVRPSYWTALGHDAGVLARGAVATLPPDTTAEPKAVAQRRGVVQAGLLATRTRLWTTDETTVGPDRILARTLRIVTWARGKP